MVLLVLFIGSSSLTQADFRMVLENQQQIWVFLQRLSHPDGAYLRVVWLPFLQTLAMSFIGTVVGFILAVPFSFLATEQLTENRLLSLSMRFLLSLLRTVPALLLAVLLVAIFGIGEATGVLTIALFTVGMVSQLMFQTVETIETEPIEAMRAIGANRIQVIVWSVLPQIMSPFIGYFLYAFEVNVRASMILGYVGAGGLGVLLNSALALRQYERVSVLILIIFGTLVCVDLVSEHMRRNYQ